MDSSVQSAVGAKVPFIPNWWAKFESVQASVSWKIGERWAGPDRRHDVHELQLVRQTARRAYPDDVLDTVFREELPAVDPDGRDAHAAGLDGDTRALPEPRVALDAAHVVHELRLSEEVFGYVLGPERVSGHEDGFCKVAFHGAVVRCGHGFYLH